MPRFERVKDKYKELRKDLYGNIEPIVELTGITMPLYKPRDLEGKPIEYDKMGLEYASTCYDSETMGMEWKAIEMMPAIAASTSYNSKEKLEGNYEKCCALNRNLIKQKHLTPFEIVQYCINISGLSKAAGAQLSRYRQSGHISRSRRFVTAEPSFVYPILDYIDNEEAVKRRLRTIEEVNAICFGKYEHLRQEYKGTLPVGAGDFYPVLDLPALHKEDARFCLPVSSSTARTMWVNVRSLRHIFDERLRADSEIEIRRLAWMIWDLVEPLCPSFYWDIKEEMNV
jgi:flavin-dependent thymidylate synthase